jgi:hypothetical protein
LLVQTGSDRSDEPETVEITIINPSCQSIKSERSTGTVARTATGILALARNVIHPLIDDRHSAFITTCKTSVREKVNEANQSS